jgi:hypothetical protein|tara:strand:- start:29 stop:244 length:216 start_codon:yes stop_codon:yes gene_type:complete
MMDRKMKNYSVADVAAANKRFYEKFPSAKEDAAMLKKAMLNPGDEIVKEVEAEQKARAKMMKKLEIEIEIS